MVLLILVLVSELYSLNLIILRISVVSLEAGYSGLLSWPDQVNSLHRKSLNAGCSELAPKDWDDEIEGVQSNKRWAYVKVNMDGVMVGRKICMLDHGGYLGLARKLEEMFGRHSASGLRLFEFESEYFLFYKDDLKENWRNVGNVPWKEFVEQVKRLRICQKNEAIYRPYSSPSFN